VLLPKFTSAPSKVSGKSVPTDYCEDSSGKYKGGTFSGTDLRANALQESLNTGKNINVGTENVFLIDKATNNTIITPNTLCKNINSMKYDSNTTKWKEAPIYVKIK